MLKLRVDGKVYEGFKQVSVYKSLGEISNYFSFTATNSTNVFPINNGAYVEVITEDGDIVTTGYIRRMTNSYSYEDHTISFDGYGTLQDLVDSSVLNKDFEGPTSLQAIIGKVLNDLNMNGVKITNNAGTIELFSAGENIYAEQEQSAYDFLERLGRKRQVFYKTGIDGSLEIIQGYDGELEGILLNEPGNNNSNIMAASFKSDRTALYHRNRIVSSLGTAGPRIDDLLSSITGSNEKDMDSTNKVVDDIIDEHMRDTRYLEIIAEENLETNEMLNRLKWEVNLRWSASELYTATLQGHKLNGVLLDTNKLIRVKDNTVGIDRKLLIKSLEYKYDLESGSTTMITCVNRDAYKAELMTYQEDEGGGITKLLSDLLRMTNEKRPEDQ